MKETHRTLQIEYLPLRPLLLALAISVLLLAAVEIVARTPFVEERLPFPSVVGTNARYSTKLYLLDEYVAREGSIECIYLGSSQVGHAFHPSIFAEEYSKIAGRELECFNFGIGGLTLAEARPMAELLVNRYQPDLLIYGLGIRDLTMGANEGLEQTLVDSPWVRYQLGASSATGWLAEHSRAYQYYLTFTNWLRDPKWEENLHSFKISGDLAYVMRPEDGFVLDEVPGLHDDWLDSCAINPKHISNLRSVLAHVRETPADIIVTTVPLPAVYDETYRIDPADGIYTGQYERCLLQPLGESVRQEGSRLIPFNGRDLIPDDAWEDGEHVSDRGSAVYSAWLGRQIAQYHHLLQEPDAPGRTDS